MAAVIRIKSPPEDSAAGAGCAIDGLAGRPRPAWRPLLLIPSTPASEPTVIAWLTHVAGTLNATCGLKTILATGGAPKILF